MARPENRYDVLISGGGPVGLVTAYGLQRMGTSTCVIERLEKSELPMYGRAAALFPRSLELLHQYDLLHPLAQVGLITRSSVNYDRNGNRDSNRGMRHVFESMAGNTFLDYMLNIRLKYSEEIFQREYERIGGTMAIGWELVELSTEEADPNHPVKATIQRPNSSESKLLAGKYMIGADGVHSTVRRLSNIGSETDKTTLRWVRIDGIVETNMPDSRAGYATLESPTHGNVLWANIDHGRTRVGFALSSALIQKYGETPTQEDCVREAKMALKPFTLGFQCVDWYTTYSVRHSVADTFVRDRVLLVGDACHAHSSGTAQGMNTGVHDAVNLAWKLAGVVKRWYNPSILSTYNTERRPIAEKLIRLDKTYSALLSGKVPPELAAISTSADPNVLFTKVSHENIQFNTGLGIHYPANSLNTPTKSGAIPSGWRAPDVLVYAPGMSSRLPTRLQSVMKNYGAFWVLVFAGEPLLTKSRLQSFRAYIDSPAAASSFWGTSSSEAPSSDQDDIARRSAPLQIGKVEFLTLIVGNRPQADEAMCGIPRFGDAYYDHDSSAHLRYGAGMAEGAVYVVRPDGHVGFATRLDAGEEVGEYFVRIFAGSQYN